MKKLIITLALLLPLISQADFAATWVATSTSQGWILPQLISGTRPTIVAPVFNASSSTQPSIFQGGIKVFNGNDVNVSTNSLVSSGNNTILVGGSIGEMTLHSVGMYTITSDGGYTLQSNSNTFQNTFFLGTSYTFGQDITINSAQDILLNPSRNIGIGTSSPYAKLSVVGPVVASYFVGTTTATSTFGHSLDIQSGCFSIAGVCISAGGSSQWTTNGSSIYYNTGNVGLGTSTPGTKLSLGDTGASTINISETATSTFGTGINLRTGCFALNGTCISGGGTSPSTITYSDLYFWARFVTPASVQGQDPFTGAALVSGTTNTVASSSVLTTKHRSGVLTRSAAGAFSGGRWQTALGGYLIGANQVFEAVAQVPGSVASRTVTLGFTNQNSGVADTSAHSLWLEINNLTVKGVTSRFSNASSTTATTYTLSSGDTDWYRFKIVTNSDWSTATFYVYNDSDTEVWTDSLSTSTTLPNTSTSTAAVGMTAISRAGGATELLNLDYMGFGTVAGYNKTFSN